MKSAYFRRLTFTIISVVFLMLLALSIALYFSFQSITLDYIYKTNLSQLEQIEDNVSQINEYTKNFTTSLFSNSNCQQLMYNKNNKMVDLLNCFRELQNLRTSTPYIQSIEIYNKGTDKVYYIGDEISLIRTLENPFDNDFPGLIQDYRNSLINPLPRKIVLSLVSHNSANILSYTITEKMGLNGETNNALVVNVYESWIFNAARSSGQESTERLFLIGSEGVVKSSTDGNRFMEDLSAIPYIQELFLLHERSSCFVREADGEKSLISYIRLESPDWYIVSVIPYSYIAKSIERVRMITVIISILTIFLGAFISLFYSRRLYSPVKSLLTKMNIKTDKTVSPADRVNEFEYITNSVLSSLDELKSLRAFQIKSINIVQQEYLRSLLFANKPFDKSNSEAKQIDLQIDLNSPISLVLFKIDHYRAFQSENSKYEQISIKYGLTNISKEIISSYLHCETCDIGNDQIIAIIQPDKGCEPEKDEKLRQMIEEITNVFYKYFEIDLSAFIGGICTDISEISDFYNDIVYISGYRLICGHRCIISRPDIERRGHEYFDAVSLNLAPFLEAVKLCNIEKLKTCYECIELKLCEYHPQDIVLAASYISSMIFNTLSILESNGNFVLNVSYSSFSTELNACETLEEIKEKLFLLLSNVAQKTNRDRNNKTRQMLSKIISYISQNYLLPNISSNTIAEKFNITPAYLNKILREEVSTPVSEYIMTLKLKKACSLLADTDMVVDKIVEVIGWDNKTYFYTMFRKIHGVTPNEYRLKMRSLAFDSKNETMKNDRRTIVKG